ncbi:MAG TPA: hypothetical protein VG318_12290 [Actinomycetota bacterium]|nr:hypothetical protein [Actinomycetota bacterium]
MRGGFAVLAGGALLDLVFHAATALSGADAAHAGDVATAIHALVLAGMCVTFAGVLQVALRPQGAVTRKETR